MLFFVGVVLLLVAAVLGMESTQYRFALQSQGEVPNDASSIVEYEELSAQEQEAVRRAIDGETLTYSTVTQAPGPGDGRLVVYYRDTPYVFSRSGYFPTSSRRGTVVLAVGLAGALAVGVALRASIRDHR